MDRLVLSGGAYEARSAIAAFERCVNYYPEVNKKDEAVPYTYYQRPGLKALQVAGDVPQSRVVRCLYQASNGSGFTVIGNEVFRIFDEVPLRLKKLGEVTAGRTNPVSMADNGATLLVVDGIGGWQVFLKGVTYTLTGNIYNGRVIDGLVGEFSVGTTGLAIGMILSSPGNLQSDTPTHIETIVNETTISLNKIGLQPTAYFTGSLSGTTLTVTNLQSNSSPIAVGMFIITETDDIIAGTKITALGSGTGGTGTYTVNTPQTVTSHAIVGSAGIGASIDFLAGEDFFAPVTDASRLFTGADRVDVLDTFILWNIPSSDQFGSTLSSGSLLFFDPLYVAAKASYPDPLQTLYINRREIILFGSFKSEMWYNAGGAIFPFAEIPGTYIEHGIAAKYSVASSDISVFWLSRDLQGQGMVMRQRGYQTQRISNHALELAIFKMQRIDDAIGFVFQIDGHVFYFLTFPTADVTWVFDDAISDPNEAWHQEAWTDESGQLRRHRANCFAAIFGKLIVGDWENSTLYEMSLDAYSDEVGGIARPMSCIRGTHHLQMLSRSSSGSPILLPVNGRRIDFKAIWLDMECGQGTPEGDDEDALVALRWSDDKGQSFGQDVFQSAGALGDYLSVPQWRGLGIARDRIFEISHSINGPAALNGLFIDGDVLYD